MDILTIVAVTLLAGFLGGLLGVGGGILMVPTFLFLLKDRIPNIHVAVGTSMAIIVVNALAGTVQHGLHKHVNWEVVAWAAAFAVIGGSLGAKASDYVSQVALQRIFAVLLIAVALRMFFTEPRETTVPPAGKAVSAATVETPGASRQTAAANGSSTGLKP